jgi:hypothetical protein
MLGGIGVAPVWGVMVVHGLCDFKGTSSLLVGRLAATFGLPGRLRFHAMLQWYYNRALQRRRPSGLALLYLWWGICGGCADAERLVQHSKTLLDWRKKVHRDSRVPECAWFSQGSCVFFLRDHVTFRHGPGLTACCLHRGYRLSFQWWWVVFCFTTIAVTPSKNDGPNLKPYSSYTILSGCIKTFWVTLQIQIYVFSSISSRHDHMFHLGGRWQFSEAQVYWDMFHTWTCMIQTSNIGCFNKIY